MGWANNPKIRDLEPYAKKHGFTQVITIGIRDDGMFEVLSYGRTKALCGDAEKVNKQIYNMIVSGDIIFEN